MATVDTSIYSNLLRAPKTVAEYDAEAMAAQQSKLALQADRMKVDEYARKVEGQNKLRGIVSSFGADRTANQNMLYKGGLLTEAEDYGRATATQAKAQADAQKAKLETAFKEIEYTGQLMSGIRDQASYTAAREKVARDLGPEAAAQIPEAYDPAAVEAFRVQATDIKTQLEQKWKQLDHTLNTDKFAYQKTNDAANRGVQIRGQDVSAASSRYSADRSAASAAQRLAFDKTKPLDGAGKPIPTAALKMQQAELDAIGTASSIQADLGAIEQQIKGGKLNFGPVNNLLNKGRNMAGISTEESRNMESFKSTIEKLRNDSLRLNAGVQTDGDAQRAWSELIDNINDKGVVTQRLAEIKRINSRAVQLRRLNVDGIRANYGRDPLDTAKYEDQPAAIGKSAIPSGWSVKER